MANEIMHAPERTPSGMELLAELSRKTDDPQVAVAVAKAVVDIQIQMNRFQWETEDRQGLEDFNNALKSCQEQVGRIAPNRTRENSIAWADYAELDRILRPIYTKAGFSITFSEHPELRDGKVLICATLSRSRQNRQFFQSVTPAGNPKMSAADMEASGQSRAQRYLMLKIFNIAIGIDKDEKAPFQESELMAENVRDEYLDALNNAPDLNSLKSLFAEAWEKAKKLNDHGAKQSFQKVYEAQKRKLA